MKNESAKKQRRFLAEWSIFNFIGWVVGICVVVVLGTNLDTIEYLAWRYHLANDLGKAWYVEALLVWFPLGVSIGIFQWVKLRNLKISPFSWILLTVVGWGVFVTLYSCVDHLFSFEHRMKYNIPYWVINLSLGITLPTGRAVIGALQSLALRKHISGLGLWIRAYIFGLSLLAIAAYLGMFFKSYLLNLLYFLLDPLHSFEIWAFFVEMRWVLFFGFLLMITALCISLLTGKILLHQSNKDSVTIKAG